jgi:hypothetical protein
MVGAALGLVVFPDGRLLSVSIPLMLALLLPPEETRFVNPLVRASSEDERILLPDTAAGKLEPCLLECPAEIEPLRIGMPYIDASVIILLNTLRRPAHSRKKICLKRRICKKS